MVSIDRHRYQYRVDRDDKIAWVNSWWLAFARENSATELTESSVVGHCLWDFIADEETCQLYQRIHSRVRGHDETVVLPFRCDSPTVRRYMQLIITGKVTDEDLLYEGGIIQVEPRRYLPVLDPRQPRTESFLWMCSCCKRVLLEPHGWLEVEDISERLQLRKREKLPRWRQSLCQECRELVKDLIV